jgi:hypothetical protein
VIPARRPGYDRAGAGIVRTVRTMYALYWLVIVGGLALFWVVGLTVE